MPDGDAVSQCLVVTDDSETRGVAFDPSGIRLLNSVDDAVTGGIATEPTELAEQLTEAVVEQFEMAKSATPDVDSGGGRLTVTVSDSAFGPLDSFDHPIPSLLATGLADSLSTPVTVEITEGQDDQADYIIDCQWEQPD
jgi:hypothetical protein